MDAWDFVALVFFLAITVFAGLFWLIAFIERNNPFAHARRNMEGRRRMATDWKRPDYLPGDWS